MQKYKKKLKELYQIINNFYPLLLLNGKKLELGNHESDVFSLPDFFKNDLYWKLKLDQNMCYFFCQCNAMVGYNFSEL